MLLLHDLKEVIKCDVLLTRGTSSLEHLTDLLMGHGLTELLAQVSHVDSIDHLITIVINQGEDALAAILSLSVSQLDCDDLLELFIIYAKRVLSRKLLHVLIEHLGNDWVLLSKAKRLDTVLQLHGINQTITVSVAVERIRSDPVHLGAIIEPVIIGIGI